MSTQKDIRERKKIILNLGAQIESIEHSGKSHIKINVEYLGNRRVVVCASSASDQRQLKNFKGDITKWIRELKNAKH